MFCRKLEVSMAFKLRLWRTHGVEAHITIQVEVRRQRKYADHQLKVVHLCDMRWRLNGP
jgi:hypothetical protein